MRWHFPYAVEVVAFFGCACQDTFTTIQYQYIYQVVAEEYNFTKNHSLEYCTPNTSSVDENEQLVTDEVSRWTLYTMIAGYITCAIGSTVITTWSDRIGRKIGIAIPMIGATVAATMQCVVFAYGLPLYTLVFAQVIYGTSGTYSTLLSVGCAYLSDIVTLEDRGKRFNMLEITSSLGAAITQMGTGYWITSSGFVTPSILVACCGLAAVLFIPFMKSSNHQVKEISETSPLLTNEIDKIKYSSDAARESISKLYTLRKQLKASWDIYTKKRCVCDECRENFADDRRHLNDIKKERLWRIWFHVLAYSLYMCAVIGISQFITMFLVSYPVCFTPVLVGAQWGLSNGLIIFVPFCLLILQGYLKFQGQTIILIGIFTRICSSALMSIARGPILVFAALGFAVFYLLTSPIMRSEVTRLVAPTEQGAALAVMTGVENVACIFSPLIFLTLYPATLHIFNGFALLVAAMVYAVAFVLVATIWIADRRIKE